MLLSFLAPFKVMLHLFHFLRSVWSIDTGVCSCLVHFVVSNFLDSCACDEICSIYSSFG